MLFSICFIYNSKGIKGAILQSSHTKHPSEVSENTKIYRNKPHKHGKKPKKPKGEDTHTGNISDDFHLKKLVLQSYLRKAPSVTELC